MAMRRSLRVVFWAVSPVLLVVALFTFTLRAGEPVPFPRREIPHEQRDPARCNWSCHNHGCRHEPRLPAFLSGDRGLFGETVRLLHVMGTAMVPARPNVGYGLVNLLVFCAIWPALMWILLGIAIWQRLRYRDERKAERAR